MDDFEVREGYLITIKCTVDESLQDLGGRATRLEPSILLFRYCCSKIMSLGVDYDVSLSSTLHLFVLFLDDIFTNFVECLVSVVLLENI